ncbi:MAG: hypothetical protein JWM44_809 [Bacilli bacterium]|nr:hypothetical protein [Bacilli bacterium]
MIVVISGLIITFTVYKTSADSALTPGSVDDPMVSKSYVDQQIASQVTAQVAAQTAKIPVGTSGGSAGLTVVQLRPGQFLMAGAGSEFIVRTGYVLAVSNDTNGIPDITAGKDILAKTAISLNHLLIFPNDKRGIQADPKKTTDIFVMVRGGYTLLNADGSVVTAAVIPVATPTATPGPTAAPGVTPTPALVPVISP